MNKRIWAFVLAIVSVSCTDITSVSESIAEGSYTQQENLKVLDSSGDYFVIAWDPLYTYDFIDVKGNAYGVLVDTVYTESCIYTYIYTEYANPGSSFEILAYTVDGSVLSYNIVIKGESDCTSGSAVVTTYATTFNEVTTSIKETAVVTEPETTSSSCSGEIIVTTSTATPSSANDRFENFKLKSFGSVRRGNIFGDINSDDKVDASDLIALSLYLVGDIQISESEKKAANVAFYSPYDEPDLADLAKLKQFVLKEDIQLGPQVVYR